MGKLKTRLFYTQNSTEDIKKHILNLIQDHRWDNNNLFNGNHYSFSTACIYGKLDLAQWLLSQDFYTVKPPFSVLQEVFTSCYHLEVFKWLMTFETETDKFDIHDHNEELFRNLCSSEKEKLDELKYLVSLEPTHGKFDIHVYNDLAFQHACESGNMSVIEFILSLEPTHGQIDIHATCGEFIMYGRGDVGLKEGALRKSAQAGHLEVVKLLISMEPERGVFQLNDGDGELFAGVCYYGHLDVAKYLISLEPSHGKVNIHNSGDLGQCMDYSYNRAYQNKHYELCQYLETLEPTHGPIYKEHEHQ